MNTTETAFLLTLNEAAISVGRSKGTLSKAIAKGDLSVKSKKGNSFQIEPAELDRWAKAFPTKKQGNGSEDRLETPKKSIGNSDLLVEVEVLRAKLSVLESSSTDKERILSEQVDDLRRRLDDSEKERREASSEIKLLTDERNITPEPPKTVFQKLFGRG